MALQSEVNPLKTSRKKNGSELHLSLVLPGSEML